MQRLKGAHRGQRAAVIFGGPSLIESRFDLASLRRRGFVTLIDTKVLTPYVLDSGLEPDYWLLLFPEKCKDNSLQHFIYRAFLAGFNIRPLLKRQYQPVAEEMTERFADYFEDWRPQRGPHKRYHYKRSVYLKDSPLDLASQIPHSRVIANEPLLTQEFAEFPCANSRHVFEQAPELPVFNLEHYYMPKDTNGRVAVASNQFYNSAAIVLYPLLRYIGFDDVYFLGMDMSMLGSVEYGALYTFKSMWHYWWYFWRTNRVFSPDYRMNRPFYMRPDNEFEDLRLVFNYPGVQFTRVVYPGFKYAARIDGISTMTLDQFQRL